MVIATPLPKFCRSSLPTAPTSPGAQVAAMPSIAVKEAELDLAV